MRAALALALALLAALAAPARAQTSATITPSLSPDRLGARAALSFTIRYASSESPVPSAVRRAVVHFPAGMTLSIPHLRSCAPARLRAAGAGGCPAQSLLGRGHALAETRAGSQLITEAVSLWAFLGPLQNGQPTLEVLGEGRTPLDERVLLGGSVLPDRPPYGEQLVLAIPAIPTLPFEPAASIVTFSLQIGPKGLGARAANTVLVPSSCPPGGFPFAADFTYADATEGSALAKAPCP
jgi:hypothetical protein